MNQVGMFWNADEDIWIIIGGRRNTNLNIELNLED